MTSSIAFNFRAVEEQNERNEFIRSKILYLLPHYIAGTDKNNCELCYVYLGDHEPCSLAHTKEGDIIICTECTQAIVKYFELQEKYIELDPSKNKYLF